MKQQDVYIPVSVEERLPDKTGWYHTWTTIIGEQTMLFEKGEWFLDGNPISQKIYVIYWLEKRTDLIVCTKEDIEECWEDGESTGQARLDDSLAWLRREAYLESKGIKL